MQNNYFKLYAHCIPVSGYKRSSICDLQREDIYYIPNIIAKILTEAENTPVSTLFERHEDNRDLLNEYLDYLIENQLGFYTDTPASFPRLNMQWDDPSYVSNAIVDVDGLHNVNFEIIFKALQQVGCKHIQVRFFRESTQPELMNMLAFLDKSLVKSIEIIVGFSEELSAEFYEQLINNYKRIKSFFIHSSPETYIHRIVDKEIGYGTNMGNIVFSEQVIESNACCGIINPFTFAVNVKTFTEAQELNTCLNRKVGIDTNGDIKNCPASKEVYGNIYEDNLEVSLKGNPAYEAKWHLKKDNIKVCRDCEHRFVCIDCRALLADPNDPLSKPLKCGYDPYTAQWSNNSAADEMFGFDTVEPFEQYIAM